MHEKVVENIKKNDGVGKSCCSNSGCCSSQMPIKRNFSKIGRNDPCYCGSGRKFKKCCGN